MSIKRYITIVFAAGVLVFFQGTVKVSAHTLKVDKAIGVTVHISPDDEPKVGTSAQIMIGVQDKESRFAARASECICTVTVIRDGAAIDTLPFVITGESGMVSYDFKDSGSYKLEVSGSPRTLDGFQSFTTSFSYRVSGQASSTVPAEDRAINPLKTYFPFVVIGAALFLVLVCLLPFKNKTKRGAK